MSALLDRIINPPAFPPAQITPEELAAYAEAYKAVTGQRVRQAGCVYLRSDGSYSVKWQQYPNDLWTFLAALRVMKWREANVR